MSSDEALKIAEKEDLDLVMIAPTAKPPVCKIMDYGKYKFEEMKREKEAKKKQKTIEIKERAECCLKSKGIATPFCGMARNDMVVGQRQRYSNGSPD